VRSAIKKLLTNLLESIKKLKGDQNMEAAKLEACLIERAETTKMEGDRTTKANGHTQIALASGSKFFLKGMKCIIECKVENVKIITLSSNQEIKKRLPRIKPEVLFFDNTTLKFDTEELLNLINDESPNTKLILFNDVAENKVSFPNAIFINKKTDSSKLSHLIRSNRLRQLR
jgi:hypothetical protein